MPLVGIDWSQTGVTHLFSAVKVCCMHFDVFFFNIFRNDNSAWKQRFHILFLTFLQENGYQLMFLSARAISQASVTRQFLVNLKQVTRHNTFQIFVT